MEKVKEEELYLKFKGIKETNYKAEWADYTSELSLESDFESSSSSEEDSTDYIDDDSDSSNVDQYVDGNDSDSDSW